MARGKTAGESRGPAASRKRPVRREQKPAAGPAEGRTDGQIEGRSEAIAEPSRHETLGETAGEPTPADAARPEPAAPEPAAPEPAAPQPVPEAAEVAAGAGEEAQHEARHEAREEAREEAGAATTRAFAGLTSPIDPAGAMKLWQDWSEATQQTLFGHWLGNLPGAPAMPTLSSVPAGFAAMLEPIRQWADMSRGLFGAGPDGPAAQLQSVVERYWTDALKLWSGFVSGRDEDVPEAARRGDKRFSGTAWTEAPLFDLVRKSYLLASHHAMAAADSFSHLPPDLAEKLRFQTRQLVEALSPANFAALNPEVIEAAKESGGQTLVRGMENMLRDLSRAKLTMTDEAAFEVGRNVAATPGKVVFENRMFQLIQYAPTTATVKATPLLIMPPWINKYYILDLTPEKSFIRWAVEQGLTVFVVSWAQASERTADATLDTYVEEGFLAAIDTVRTITGEPSVHMIGYCVAGTTLAITLAYLAATGGADRVKTATFFTAQTDFADAGDLLHFVDEATLRTIAELGKSGVFDGRYLALTFNMLRPTDLLWSYVVNNYLLGRDYVPFDLLYWNSDPTNVPAKWHLDYVRDLYRDNKLASPGCVTVKGVPIDLTCVETPAYIQAGRDDHIAPAASCFKMTRHFAGPTTFMLAGSGHIAGVVNPPSANKYMYWTLPEGVPLPANLEAFKAAAVETKGSWWPHWIGWLRPQSGDDVPARVPGTVPGFPAIEDAPGRYVKERIA